MLAESVRMKVVLALVFLMGLIVLGLPFSITGDSSLTGAVQSFMSYALTATTVLLSMLSIFLSRTLADELVGHQIYLVVTKPIARWQYVLGKWLGITILNAVFLFCAGATLFGMVYYMRWTHPPLDDRFDEGELTNEVLVARHARPMKTPDFNRPAEMEFNRNLEEGMYDDQPGFNQDEAKRLLRSKYEARWRVVGPGERRVFEFDQILCDRSSSSVIQLRYKTEVSQYPSDEIFRGLWVFGDRTKGAQQISIPIRHVVGRFHTIRVPASTVSDDHTLSVYFSNENPFEGERQYQNVIEFRKSAGVEVLFIVGSFGGNLFRLLVLIQCKLMFLAAVAILMTTVFSFPVASLASFTIYVLAGTRSFIAEALELGTDPYASIFSSIEQFFYQSFEQIYSVFFWLVPDFSKYDAVEHFVNGRNVSLFWVLQGVFWLVMVKTVVVLGAAMLLFYRREVAEVSV